MGEEPREPTRAALWEGLAVVVTGFALGLGGIVYTHFSRRAGAELDTGPGEAFAALAGAIVGLGGAEIGQATGTFRAAQEQLHGHHRRFDVALTLVAVVAAVGAGGLLGLDGDWAAATVTLLVAAFGLPLVHLRHERTTPHGGDILLGRAIIIGAVLLAVLGFRWSQGLAEAMATVAVAVMGIGATLLSHGRSLQRQATSG